MNVLSRIFHKLSHKSWHRFLPFRAPVVEILKVKTTQTNSEFNRIKLIYCCLGHKDVAAVQCNNCLEEMLNHGSKGTNLPCTYTCAMPVPLVWSNDIIPFVMKWWKVQWPKSGSQSSRNSEYSATLWSSAEKREIFFEHCHLTASSWPVPFKEQIIKLFPFSSS